MSLDKAREEFEQFEKRAALAEKQIKELSLRIAKLEQKRGTPVPTSSVQQPRAKAAPTSMILRFPKQEPALVALVAAQFVGNNAIKFTPKPDQEGTELAQYPQGNLYRGEQTVARYVARTDLTKGLYGTDELSATDVDQWLEFASTKLTKAADHKTFLDACNFLNLHLTLRTLFAGYSVTLADIAIWAALRLHPMWDQVSQEKSTQQLLRWFNYVDNLPEFQSVSSKYVPRKALAPAAGGNKSAEKEPTKPQAKYPELPGAVEGNVVTRFPPEPSGYLHMGHVKAALLNDHYARYYKGTLILRFDDTNPTKENSEFVEMITEDLKTLGITADKITFTSQYFDQIIELAEKIITEGKAYVDLTPGDQMREERKQMKESKYRNNSVEENLRLWKEMKLGSQEGQKCVLRAKIDMASKNGCMRDPSFFRVVVSPPHHRTGTKYKVYPIYDFACPIVDSLEGVTHALRSNEYHDRDEQYRWVLEALNLAHKPVIEDFSRLNFMYTLLSKRKLQWFVDNGVVEGWNSCAFPTVQGILRRGLTVEALREFILCQGFSKRDNLQGMEKLWSINKQIIDPIIPRFTAVKKEGRVPMTLAGASEVPENKTIAKHKKNPALGEKIITYTKVVFIEQEDAKVVKEGEEVTLMDWGNAIVRHIHTQDGVITGIDADLHLEGDFKKTERKLTWLPDVPDLVPVKLVEYDYLITKEKLEEKEDFKQFVNPTIIQVTEALGDPNLRIVKKGDRFQLERRGYFIVDQPYLEFDAAQPLTLILIPDGKVKTQSHLASKVTLKGTGTVGRQSVKAKNKNQHREKEKEKGK